MCLCVRVQESARQAFAMYPSRNVDKVWEVVTMLAHRDVRVSNGFHHPANTLSTGTATPAAARFNVNGIFLRSL